MKSKFIGGRELEKALGDLGNHITARAVGRRVLKKQAQPVAALANSLAPDDPETSGGLNTSYVVSTTLNKSQRKAARRDPKDDVKMYIGTNDPAGIQQEFGNSRHSAQPHFRPAWDQKKGEVLEGIQSNMGDEIAKTAKRVASRKARAKR